MSFALSSASGAGTVSVTNGSTTLTGTGTAFNTDFTIGCSISVAGVQYVLSVITSATAATLAVAYAGTTNASAAYLKTLLITQSGTDTDLSGLSGISGVTVMSTGTGEYARNIYNYAGMKLTVSGTLSIDPYTEELVTSATGNALLIPSGGTLNINGSMTLNSITKYTQRRWFTEITSYDFNTPAVRVQSGGTLNWVGAEMLVPGGFTFDSGSTVNITQGVLDEMRKFKNGSGQGIDQQIRWSSSGVNVSGLILKRGLMTLIAIPASLNGYAPQHCTRAICTSSSTPKIIIPVNGFNTDGSNDLDVGMRGGSWVHLTNPSNGTAMTVGPHLPNDYGRVAVWQTFNPVVTTAAMAAISNASVYIRDTNNTKRKNYTSDSYVNGDDTADKVYVAATGAGGNLASALSLFTGAVSVLSGTGTSDPPNTGAYSWDYRCKSGNTTDDFDVYVWHYSYLLSKYTIIAKGGANGSVVTSGTAMLADSTVILSSSAAAALTTISTASNLYDRAKYYKCQTVQANLETNGIGNLIVTLNGTTINAGAYNVAIDAAAASVFVIAGSTITIKASTFTGNIITTGTVSFANGATISGYYVDSTGTHVLLSVTGLVAGSRIQLYNTTDASEIYNAVVAGTSYSQFITYTSDKTIRLRVAYVSGVTAYNEYQTLGVLTSNGLGFVVAQTLNTVFNANAVSVTTGSEFSTDYAQVRVNITDPDAQTSVQRLYSWYCYNNTTSLGIANFFGGITAQDTLNYVVNTAVVNLQLFNVNTAAAILTGARLVRDDGLTVIAASSNSLQIDPGKAYVANSDAIQVSLASVKSNTNLIPALL